MSLLTLTPAAWLVGPWVVPLIGTVVCVIAYLILRRMLLSDTPTEQVQDIDEVDIRFLGGITRDRRVAPRRKGNTIQIHVRLTPEAEPIIGWVLDRSIGGLGILLDQPLDPGLPVQVRSRTASETTPWIEATVRSCRPEGSQYEVGLQFIHIPSWNLMLQFG